MDFNQVLELIRTVSASELTAFQYEEGNQKILMHAGNVVWNDMAGGMAAGSVVPDSVMSAGMVSKNTMPGNIASENKAPDTVTPSYISAPSADNGGEPQGNLVKSPLVGRFYTAPSEEAEVYVKVGDHVKKGQVLAIVEAMKLMNEIESEYDGVVAEILASDGEGVEYGQPLFRIA